MAAKGQTIVISVCNDEVHFRPPPPPLQFTITQISLFLSKLIYYVLTYIIHFSFFLSVFQCLVKKNNTLIWFELIKIE